VTVAIVTGAASGIGRATTELLTERGAGVVAVDTAPDGWPWPDGDRIATVTGDVATLETNAEMVAVALDRFGRLDVAVLNAGIGFHPGLEEHGALERFEEILDVDLRGVFFGMHATLPVIAAGGGGAVVATASVTGLRADPGAYAYVAAKAGVIGLVRALAIDYATRGVRVNAVCPGPTETGLTAGMRADREVSEELRRHVPLQRWAQPREIAEVICFLASPAASFVTGVTVPVDGGVLASTGMFLPPQADVEPRPATG
jgi:meso-butanediol dehydrogenase/(S,S)-butanediol dehydrogenase/diacetyl reductase